MERLRPQPYVIKLDGSAAEPARPDLTEGWTSVRAAWHRDGQLTFWGRNGAGQWTMAKAAPAGGAAIRYVVPPELAAQMDASNLTLRSFAWAPSGEFVYFEGVSMQVRNLWRVRVNPSTMAWMGAPERLTLGEGADSDLSLANDGKSIAFAVVKERTRLWALPIDGSRKAEGGQALTAGGAGEFDAAVSPDGRVLVYRTVRAGRQELWARSLADENERLLISGTDWVRSSPRLSTDGTRVAYRLTPVAASRSHSRPSVAILEPNGAEIVVSAPGAQPFFPDDWSADDSTILGGCTSPGSPQFGICTIAARPNSEPRFLVKEPDREFFSPHYSPNQRWISVVERTVPRRPEWNGAISVLPVSGGARIPITDGKWNDEKPRWSADGRAIYFVSNRGGFLNLWCRRFNPNTGTPEGEVFQVTRFNDPTRMLPTDMGQVETSVSGDRVFLPLTETTSTIWSLEGVDR